MLTILVALFREALRQEVIDDYRKKLREVPIIPYRNHDNICYMSTATTMVLFSPVLSHLLSAVNLESKDLNLQDYEIHFLKIIQDQIRKPPRSSKVSLPNIQCELKQEIGAMSDADPIFHKVVQAILRMPWLPATPENKDFVSLQQEWSTLVSYATPPDYMNTVPVDIAGHQYFRALRAKDRFVQAGHAVSLESYIEECDEYSSKLMNHTVDTGDKLPSTDTLRYDFSNFRIRVATIDAQAMASVLTKNERATLRLVLDSVTPAVTYILFEDYAYFLYAMDDRDHLWIRHKDRQWKLELTWQTKHQQIRIINLDPDHPTKSSGWFEAEVLNEKLPADILSNMTTYRFHKEIVVRLRAELAETKGQNLDAISQSLSPLDAKAIRIEKQKSGKNLLILEQDMIYKSTSMSQLTYDIYSKSDLTYLATLTLNPGSGQNPSITLRVTGETKLSESSEQPVYRYHFDVKNWQFQIRKNEQRIHFYRAPAVTIIRIQPQWDRPKPQRILVPLRPIHLPGTDQDVLYTLVAWSILRFQGGSNHWTAVCAAGLNSFWLHDDRLMNHKLWKYPELTPPTENDEVPVHLILERTYPPHPFHFPI